MNSSMDTFYYYYYSSWEIAGDARVSNFPLMRGGPWTVLSILFAYIWFVKVSGPQLMKSRPAYDLRRVMFVYNLVMSLFNGYFFGLVAIHSNFGLITWRCTPNDPSAFDDVWKWRLKMGWVFFMSKFVDLADTFFFVARKNFHQVSALHVIHHAAMPLNVWLGFKFIPSESVVFLPFVNSFVHCVMYFYYALSTLGPNVRKYLWWKRYLTMIQIIQLIAIAVHCVYIASVPNCRVPKFLFYAFGFPQSLLFVYMFCSFFYKNYYRRPQPQLTPPEPSATIKKKA